MVEDLENKGMAVLESSESAAEKIFLEIVEIDKDNITANFQLSLIYVNKKQYTKALWYAKKVRKANPYEENINLNIGFIYEKCERFSLAEKYYKFELKHDPFCGEAAFKLADLYFNRGRWKSAVRFYVICIKMNYAVEEMLQNLSIAARRSSDLKAEMYAYQVSLDRNPNDFWGISNMGAALIDAGEYHKARIKIKRALLLKPTDGVSLRNLNTLRDLTKSCESRDGSKP